jgi:hypothetical protein
MEGSLYPHGVISVCAIRAAVTALTVFV